MRNRSERETPNEGNKVAGNSGDNPGGVGAALYREEMEPSSFSSKLRVSPVVLLRGAQAEYAGGPLLER